MHYEHRFTEPFDFLLERGGKRLVREARFRRLAQTQRAMECDNDGWRPGGRRFRKRLAQPRGRCFRAVLHFLIICRGARREWAQAVAAAKQVDGRERDSCMRPPDVLDEVEDPIRLSDTALLDEVKRLAAGERHATARLIAALSELDARRLYLGEGCSSLFTYCTQVLHLSEHAAYLRIEAARAARRWPDILGLLADGALHLTAVGLLAPHLTLENHERALAAARHKSKREVEEIVAALRPLPAVPSSVRKLAAVEDANLAGGVDPPVPRL